MAHLKFTTGTSFGIIGEQTDFTYTDGTHLHVGDIVKTSDIEELSVVVNSPHDGYGVMGLCGWCIVLGKYVYLGSNNRTVTLIKKYTSLTGEEHIRRMDIVGNLPSNKKAKKYQ